MTAFIRSFGAREAAKLLPLPDAQGNKYTRGALAVIAGSARYPGAAVLAARAAARAGAGYTTLVTSKTAAQAARFHLVSIPVMEADEKDGALCPAAASEAVQASCKAKALVVGPGIDRLQGVQDFVWNLLEEEFVRQIPLVLDADALYAIAQDKERFIALRSGGCTQVLTPHEGEAARLLGEKVEDRHRAARALAKEWCSVVVLKGPQTLVASPEGEIATVENAGPELAKAGTGDVLAGMIGAFAAQGLDLMDAACLGVYLHGRAGLLAAKKMSPVSVMPEDLLEYIGYAICSLEGWSPQLASALVDLSRRAQL